MSSARRVFNSWTEDLRSSYSGAGVLLNVGAELNDIMRSLRAVMTFSRTASLGEISSKSILRWAGDEVDEGSEVRGSDKECFGRDSLVSMSPVSAM